MVTVMIMAGGTGGHVMPALAVARQLAEWDVSVSWLGTACGLEAKILKDTQIPFDTINIKSLRGSSVWRKITMPFRLVYAISSAFIVIRRRKPKVVLGMGGFVAGPGGVAAILLRLPLILHEQNTVAGLTNRLLASHARRVLSGFPSVEGLQQYQWLGNPVRDDITALPAPQIRFSERQCPLRLLIIGGSQGARVFNHSLPQLLEEYAHIDVWHQCGNVDQGPIKQVYDQFGICSRVSQFIDDMAGAYKWCDIVICRSGAMTVAEICSAGIVAIFIPFPYAVDDHQAKNALYLVQQKAAYMIRQEDLTQQNLMKILSQFGEDRRLLSLIAGVARKSSKPNATREVAKICLEVANA